MEDTIQDDIAAFHAAFEGGDVSEPAPETAPSPESAPVDASGGGTPTGDTDSAQRSASIPRERFDQINARMQQAEAQVSQLAPYLGLISQLQQSGASPETLLQSLGQNPAPGQPSTPDPLAFAPERFGAPANPAPAAAAPASDQDRFESFLTDQLGIDPAAVADDPLTVKILEQNWRLHEQVQQANGTLQGFQQAQAERERAAAIQTTRDELAQVSQEMPAFADPQLQAALVSYWGGLPENVTLKAAAQQLLTPLTVAARNLLSEEALRTQAADAQRPVTAGGAAPSPVETAEWALSDDDDVFSRGFRSELKAGMDSLRR